MNTLSLKECQELLLAIKAQHRQLSGSEFKAIVEAVDAHRGEPDGGKMARQVAMLLARHPVAGTKPPFGDPDLNHVFAGERQRDARPGMNPGHGAPGIAPSATPAHAHFTDENPHGKRDRYRPTRPPRLI